MFRQKLVLAMALWAFGVGQEDPGAADHEKKRQIALNVFQAMERTLASVLAVYEAAYPDDLKPDSNVPQATVNTRANLILGAWAKLVA